MVKLLNDKNKFRYIILSMVICVLVFAITFFYYKVEQKEVYSLKGKELTSIAELKIKQVRDWYLDELHDAEIIAKNPFIKKTFNNNLLQIDFNLIKEHLVNIKHEHDYEKIFITDLNGQIIVSTENIYDKIDSVTAFYINKSISEKITVSTNIYLPENSNNASIGFITPIFNFDNVIKAVLIFKIDPEEVLFPRITYWPFESSSAETYIVKVVDNNIIFINSLRHKKNEPLKFIIPLNDLNIVTVQAAKGYSGIFSGKDYRGVEVFSYVNKIEDTDWYLIAKIDYNEIFDELYERVLLIVIISILFLILSGIAISLFYINSQKQIYIDLHRSNEIFKTTIYSIGDGIITTDKNGNIKNMNRVAENLTGWKEKEAENKSIDEIFNIISEDTNRKLEIPVNKVLRDGLIIGLANHTLLISKDGRKIPIADSAAPIKDKSGEISGVVLVFRDQTEERENEKKLKESEEKFRLMIENAPEPIFIQVDKKFAYLNPPALKLYGVKDENEIIGKYVIDTVHPDFRDKVIERIKLINEKKLSVNETYEQKLIRPDGTEVWIETMGSPFVYNNKDGALVFVRDISVRKSLEEKLIQSDRIINYSTDIVCVAGFDGYLKFVNPAFSKILGWASDEINTKPWIDFVHPDYKEKSIEISKINNKGKEVLNYENKVLSKDGSYRWFSWNTHPYIQEEVVFCLGRDVTEQKRVYEELLESEERFYLLLKATNDVIRDLDLITNELTWNDGVGTLFGYEVYEIEKNIISWNKNIHPEDYERVITSFNKVINSGNKKWSNEYRFKCKDGSYVHVLDRGYIIHNKENKPVRMLSGMTDITEKIRIQEEAKKLNIILEERVAKRTEQLQTAIKELEAFTYTVSHDLRAPLRGIHGFTQILVEDYKDKFDDEGKRIANLISSNTIKMGELIDDLLQFSRLSRSELNKSDVDMNTMAYSIFCEVTTPEERKKIIFNIEELPFTFGDSNMLRQVWVNLISNAIKFSAHKEKPEINIKYRKDKNEIIYSVHDNGAGFNMNYIDKLFGVFQRLHSEREFPGTGVGLAIVQRIISRHEGKVWAEAVEGKGASFYFSLPDISEKKDNTG